MKEYLPIGTVIQLIDGEKPVMIYGRKQVFAETNEVYDYVACLYPEGNLSQEFTYLFNHDQVDKVLFKGYVNEDEEEFQKILEEFDNIDDTELLTDPLLPALEAFDEIEDFELPDMDDLEDTLSHTEGFEEEL